MRRHTRRRKCRASNIKLHGRKRTSIGGIDRRIQKSLRIRTQSPCSSRVSFGLAELVVAASVREDACWRGGIRRRECSSHLTGLPRRKKSKVEGEKGRKTNACRQQQTTKNKYSSLLRFRYVCPLLSRQMSSKVGAFRTMMFLSRVEVWNGFVARAQTHGCGPISSAHERSVRRP